MSKTVLVVDDSSSVREAVGFTLSHEGFEVLKAATGKHAMKYFEQSHIDLVITDLHMPEMSGIELTQKIRQLPGHNRVPVLLLTTESQVMQRQEARKAGATGWIIKPFVPERLTEIVKRFIR